MDLNRIGDLYDWEVGEESVRLGASVPHSGIMEYPRAELAGRALASRTVASPQIRNRGGVGGNLGTASPAGDAHPALLAAGAEADTELGLVKVVELACAQDVGKALDPLSVVGQIQGGTTQGLGVAVTEEIVVDPRTAKVRNPSFTDYLVPTLLDAPTIPVDVLELADDHAPYGLRGVGEASTLSSTPAVLAAIRDATGLELNRTPVRPEHLTGPV
ncbi:molybdopterin cofactor-binding domain-containing protein [Streptomyces fimbriatus]|uniref:Molybdopterin cofactor-binding domain-containing protein n=1 Tax=Streptomyces fimbriatus TaxID=68197 RepID=A0ABW0D344_STRFI